MDDHNRVEPYSYLDVISLNDIQLESSIYIEGSNFQNNFASDTGGAIYGISFTALDIESSTLLEDNFALTQACEIYLSQSTG